MFNPATNQGIQGTGAHFQFRLAAVDGTRQEAQLRGKAHDL